MFPLSALGGMAGQLPGFIANAPVGSALAQLRQQLQNPSAEAQQALQQQQQMPGQATDQGGWGQQPGEPAPGWGQKWLANEQAGGLPAGSAPGHWGPMAGAQGPWGMNLGGLAPFAQQFLQRGLQRGPARWEGGRNQWTPPNAYGWQQPGGYVPFNR